MRPEQRGQGQRKEGEVRSELGGVAQGRAGSRRGAGGSSVVCWGGRGAAPGAEVILPLWTLTPWTLPSSSLSPPQTSSGPVPPAE